LPPFNKTAVSSDSLQLIIQKISSHHIKMQKKPAGSAALTPKTLKVYGGVKVKLHPLRPPDSSISSQCDAPQEDGLIKRNIISTPRLRRQNISSFCNNFHKQAVSHIPRFPLCALLNSNLDVPIFKTSLLLPVIMLEVLVLTVSFGADPQFFHNNAVM
jgi:hypothetical protein